MKRLWIALILVLIVFPLFVEPSFALVRNKTETTTNWKALCDRHPAQASYESIGKSIKNADIWIYKIGNPQGGRVMWDGEMHGSEDIGSECEYIFATWLLESGDPKAANYLKTNYFLCVPIVNIDTTNRHNLRRDYTYAETIGTPYENTSGLHTPVGVNLNRNFPNGWGASGSSDPTNEVGYQGFRGIKPGSEPETQAMVNAFTKFKPKIYVNTHMWGGPEVDLGNTYNTTLLNQIITGQQAYFDSVKPKYNNTLITPYPFKPNINEGGYASWDANARGITSFLIECDPPADPNFRTGSYSTCPLWAIQQFYYPKILGILLATMDATAIVATGGVTFDATRIDFVGNLLEVDDVYYTRADMPLSLDWAQGSQHTFAWLSPLTINQSGSVTTYVWYFSTGLSNAQSGTITVTTYGTLVGHYRILTPPTEEYYLLVILIVAIFAVVVMKTQIVAKIHAWRQ